MNIYDIAEQCGVSIATVSRVLNNNKNVSAATRAKIQAVIDAAGYTPSALARNLGNGGQPVASAPALTGVVGVLCPSMQDPYQAELLATLEAGLQRRNHSVLLRSDVETPEQEQTALQELLAAGVAAVLYLCPLHYEQTVPTPIATAAAQVPVILVEGKVDIPGVYNVTSDRSNAAAELVELLMRRQRRRILFLYHRMSHGCQQTLEGFKTAYAKAGVPMDEQLIVRVDNRLEDVNACIKRLLVNRVTFDAVIGAEDLLALGAHKSLGRTGLNMPVIGFGNSLVARCATPELTSVDCDATGLCKAAVAVLDDLQNGKEAPQSTLLPTKLVERDTFRNV
ncbi:MAG: LacI family transcriptional regulator [Ruminococcaceae bacterium]|nr:LacI family transcriptional regulator [Oscillospiraceae bacterium]